MRIYYGSQQKVDQYEEYVFCRTKVVDYKV